MAFLNNSGDIILDAVLTVHGRKSLANGTFRVAKFALGDDEINYGLYDKTNTSGSAYYDLSILKMPVEIAFTKDDISQKSRLIRTIAATNLLYLPELKLDQVTNSDLAYASGRNAYAIVVDDNTYDDATATSATGLPAGILDGRSASDSLSRRIKTPLGLNGGPSDWKKSLSDVDAALEETQYNITLDGRFLQLAEVVGSTPGVLESTGVLQGGLVQPSAKSAVFSNGDNLDVYTITTATHPTLFTPGPNQNTKVFDASSTANILTISFVAQDNLDYLFTTYTDESVTSYASVSGLDVNVVKTSVQIQTAMGFQITVPLEFIRRSS
tara:strand:+ start:27986 stop:28963 length:978 start_codon:yes stop_codon:yes gene_type:complete